MSLSPAYSQRPAHGSSAETPDYRFFDVRGSHGDIGHLLGQQDPPFAMQPWWAPPEPLAFTDECAAVVRAIHPALMDEFASYAEAQGWSASLLWQQSCRVNLKARFRLGTEGCSTVVWYVRGHAIIGRNYDYWPLQARRQRIRFCPTAAAYATIGARGGVPSGRYDGMNQFGVFASLHVIMTDSPEIVRPGVPFHLVPRLALELCSTAYQAVDLLMHVPHLSSLNYLVADPHEAFVVEADPRRVRAIPMEAEVTVVTNHYRHPEMRPLQRNRALTNSICRLRKLSEVGTPPQPDADTETLLEHAKSVMSDRTVPVCGLGGSLSTLWSCVAELSSGRIQYAPGPPCNTPYEEIKALRA